MVKKSDMLQYLWHALCSCWATVLCTHTESEIEIVLKRERERAKKIGRLTHTHVCTAAKSR